MLVNLTPHALTLRDSNGVDHVLPASGTVARVSSTPGKLVDMGFPVPVATPDVFGAVVDLPDPVEGTFYVVSGMVGSALVGSGRTDVLVPGTGPADGAVRNADRQVVGITRLKSVC